MTKLLKGLENKDAELLENGDLKDGDNAIKLMMEDSYFKKMVGKSSIITRKSNIPTNKEAISKAGIVINKKLYEVEITPYQEFLNMGKTQQHICLYTLNENFTAQQIAQEWGLEKYEVYALKKSLRNEGGESSRYVPKHKSSTVIEKINPKKEKSKITLKPSSPEIEPTPELIENNVTEITSKLTLKKVETTPMNIHLKSNKVLSGELVSDFILRIIELVKINFTEENKFIVKLKIKKMNVGIPHIIGDDEERPYTIELFEEEITNSLLILSKEDLFSVIIEVKVV